MKVTKKENNRRDFLKKCGISTASLLLPATGLNAMPFMENKDNSVLRSKTPVHFIYDGLELSPYDYLEKLQEINSKRPIEPDYYGVGGDTKRLEEEFARLTGKEKAIYLPTGTMANQLAIKLLNQNNTKVIVPENSHVYRDEADAAQRVHGKRLVPVGKDKPYFNLADLESAIDYFDKKEVFKSGLGTIVIENPVRRADGVAVPIETIKEISNYCKKNNYKMHLDGARLHMASAYTNESIFDYASYFDTVYISLYKYLNASGGAILCGEAQLIDQISNQIKVYGGKMFQSWTNSSIALHYLGGIEERWKEVVQVAPKLISQLNKIDGISIADLEGGTNVFHLKFSDNINIEKLALYLYQEHNIWLGRVRENNLIKFKVNASILTRSLSEIVSAWKLGVDKSRQM